MGDAPSRKTFQPGLLMAQRHLVCRKVALLSAGRLEHRKLSQSLPTHHNPCCASTKHTHGTEPLH